MSVTIQCPNCSNWAYSLAHLVNHTCKRGSYERPAESSGAEKGEAKVPKSGENDSRGDAAFRWFKKSRPS
jgi:hypothetical protein